MHVAPEWLWPALVKAMLAEVEESKWTVASTRQKVSKLKKCPEEIEETEETKGYKFPSFINLETIAEALVEETIYVKDFNDLINRYNSTIEQINQTTETANKWLHETNKPTLTLFTKELLEIFEYEINKPKINFKTDNTIKQIIFVRDLSEISFKFQEKQTRLIKAFEGFSEDTKERWSRLKISISLEDWKKFQDKEKVENKEKETIIKISETISIEEKVNTMPSRRK